MQEIENMDKNFVRKPVSSPSLYASYNIIYISNKVGDKLQLCLTPLLILSGFKTCPTAYSMQFFLNSDTDFAVFY
jgi:hypothetical protein